MDRLKAPRIYTRHGFTLLETLVVLFVGVIIFIVAGGAMVRTMLAGRNEINRMARTMTARLILEQMTRDIESAFPFESEPGGGIFFQGINQTLDEGAADELTLVRPRLGAALPTELERITYRVERRDNRPVIVRSQSALPQSPEPPREILLGLPESTTQLSLNLEYQTVTEQGAQWLPDWNDPVRLPDAVRIQVEVSDQHISGTVAFEVVARVHSQLIRRATE